MQGTRRPYSVYCAFCLASFVATVVCISDESLRIIREKEDIVARLAAETARLFQSRPFAVSNCACSLHSCSFDFPGAECRTHLGGLELCGDTCDGQRIDYTQSIVRTPPGSDPDDLSASLKESICTYRNLDALFSRLQPENLAWTYIGTTDGHFRRWPAAGRAHNAEDNPKLYGCRSYDPRTRPWYITASTGPKDIVFIIDKSGSMRESARRSGPLKWNTTTDAVLAMIDTLSAGDYFNIVAFSDAADQIWTKTHLAQGTIENKETIKRGLQELVPDGGTNFKAAFELGFSLLTEACSVERVTCSECEKVIIFLTDGKDTSLSSEGGIKPSRMAAHIEDYQAQLEKETSRRASIFTFSLGSDADDAIPRQIACSNDGSWSYIDDDADPLTAMRSYYLFLAARRRSSLATWIEPYMDDSGLGLITTVTKPIFSRGAGDVDGVFLGVAGHDVLLSELGDSADVDEILNELLDRGSRCEPHVADACQLQVLRNAHTTGATCVDRFPVEAAPSDPIPCFTDGVSYYKRFPEELPQAEAKKRCRRDGGQLATIVGNDELAFVAAMASEDGSWVGAERRFNSFVWPETSAPELENDSPYWGIGQPDSYLGVEDCVSIDSRGPTANLNDVRCHERLTFICQYSNDVSCQGDMFNPRDQSRGYFTTPPVDLCVNAETSLAATGPTRSAEALRESEILCPLGRPREDAEFRCCESCLYEHNLAHSQNDSFQETLVVKDNGLSSALAIGITCVIVIVVVAFCVASILLYKKKQQTVEPKETDPSTPSTLEISVTSYTHTPSALTETPI